MYAPREGGTCSKMHYISDLKRMHHGPDAKHRPFPQERPDARAEVPMHGLANR